MRNTKDAFIFMDASSINGLESLDAFSKNWMDYRSFCWKNRSKAIVLHPLSRLMASLLAFLCIAVVILLVVVALPVFFAPGLLASTQEPIDTIYFCLVVGLYFFIVGDCVALLFCANGKKYKNRIKAVKSFWAQQRRDFLERSNVKDGVTFRLQELNKLVIEEQRVKYSRYETVAQLLLSSVLIGGMMNVFTTVITNRGGEIGQFRTKLL